MNGRIISIQNEEEALTELKSVGVSEGALNILPYKMNHIIIKIDGVKAPAANIVKQQMLSKGGDVAINRGCVNCKVQFTDIIITGTKKQYLQLIEDLKLQPYFGLDKMGEILSELIEINSKSVKEIKMPHCQWPLGKKTYIMGILNVTPDSFSDGGKYFDVQKAIEHAKEMEKDGADIIDVGGVSTRPGYSLVSVEEELRRVIPVVERLVNEINIPISVDTFRAEVAKRVLKLGVDMINDQWGLQLSEDMTMAVSEYDVPVVVMFNREDNSYEDIIKEHMEFFYKSIDIAMKNGIKKERIIIDPGIGFGKNPEQNLFVMRHLSEFKSIGLPVLLGTSRKSMIGHVLNLPVEERMEGTAATVAYGITQGVDIVRVHDVKQIARVAKMTDAMVRI